LYYNTEHPTQERRKLKNFFFEKVERSAKKRRILPEPLSNIRELNKSGITKFLLSFLSKVFFSSGGY